jgi:uncharacterized membrane protein
VAKTSASSRIEGVDVARALAGIIMIQGHAYDGWASPAAKETFAYAFTRLLGTLPLPAFLLLAGASVTLRVDAAVKRGESARDVRRAVVKRGLEVVLYGYLVSAVFALMDGFDGLDTFLRADVLHVIGLSIATVGFLGIRPARATVGARTSTDAPADRRRLGSVALGVGLATTLACPWVSRISPHTTGPLRYAVGLFSDVPGVTLMPYVPLVAWFAIGVGAAQWMLRMRRSAGDVSRGGAPRRALVALGVVGLALAVAGWLGTGVVTSALGGELTRKHPAVWMNVVDLAGRALVVLACGTLLSNVVDGAPRRFLLRIGRGSLVAYVFHIPFCYGAFARPVAGKLDMLTATALLLVLYALSFGAVWARDTLRDVVKGLSPNQRS